METLPGTLYSRKRLSRIKYTSESARGGAHAPQPGLERLGCAAVSFLSDTKLSVWSARLFVDKGELWEE